MPGLTAFFTAMVPFLRGESSADDLARELGPLPSGAKRTEVYPWLVKSDLRGALGDLFPAVRAACLHEHPDLFDRLCAAYAAESPPTHFELYRLGSSFPDFLGATARANACPPHLEEIADFHYLRYRCLTADVPVEPAWDATIFVRRYAFATPAFVASHDRGERVTVPVAGERTYVLFRSPRDGHAHWTVASPAMLLALAQHFQPESAPPSLVSLIDDRALAEARARLVHLGVLPVELRG